jgi:hypothetical protein
MPYVQAGYPAEAEGMTCTRCKHNREIARLAAEQARLRDICSHCHLGENVASSSSSSISLDAIHDGTIGRVAKVAPNHAPFHTCDPSEIDEPQPLDAEQQTRDTLQTLLACVAALPYEQVSRLVQIADTFRTLNRRQFEIVAHLLNGGTVIAYAQEHGLTKQTASARMKALFKAHPVFQAIARGKDGRLSKNAKSLSKMQKKPLKSAKILKSEKG